ncbi:MAG: hypothetical protein KJ834_10135, partial [Alphaproteobacteria bacterium]|nr:hypothetical protein [Alphaproteobacteria bacterium]
QRINMINLQTHKNGRGPDALVGYRAADNGKSGDPATGSLLQFRIVDQVESVDVPGVIHYASQPDPSLVPGKLTDQIPVVEPKRVRFIELRRGQENPIDPATGDCNPSCLRREIYPWSMRVNGDILGGFNANHISALIPKPGEVEHWVLRNPAGGWDHPVHLHFEEGITIDRDHDWLARYLQAPDILLRDGNPTAVALNARFPDVKLPFMGLTETDAKDQIFYLGQQLDGLDSTLTSAEADQPAASHDHASHEHTAHDH